MERKAILIGGEPSPNATRNADLFAWREFLRSEFGGAWRKDQIVEARDFDRGQLIALVKGSAAVDYSLIVYVGKGKEVRVEVPWAQMELELISGEKILDGELNTGSSRCGMILDATGFVPRDDRQEDPSPSSGIISETAADIYERAIEKAERGLARIWATRSSEVAEPKLSFSGLIIACAAKWAEAHQGFLTFSQATELMASTDLSSKGLAVQYRGGRRNNDLPFAVGAR